MWSLDLWQSCNDEAVSQSRSEKQEGLRYLHLAFRVEAKSELILSYGHLCCCSEVRWVMLSTVMYICRDNPASLTVSVGDDCYMKVIPQFIKMVVAVRSTVREDSRRPIRHR